MNDWWWLRWASGEYHSPCASGSILFDLLIKKKSRVQICYFHKQCIKVQLSWVYQLSDINYKFLLLENRLLGVISRLWKRQRCYPTITCKSCCLISILILFCKITMNLFLHFNIFWHWNFLEPNITMLIHVSKTSDPLAHQKKTSDPFVLDWHN